MTLLEFERTLKKPNPEPPAMNSASVKLPNIWQSPYYTCYYKTKCSNISGNKLHSDVTQVALVCTIKYEDFENMWQVYENDQHISESFMETNNFPPRFNDVLGIIESEWQEEILDISNIAMLEKLLTKLQQHGLVDDFINLMYFLDYGEMDIKSIPVRTLLETAHSLHDT